MAPHPTSTSQRSQDLWEERIVRAQELQPLHPNSLVLFQFYEKVLRFQQALAARIDPVLRSDLSLREQIDPAFATRALPSLIKLSQESGPPLLSQHAHQLRSAGKERWKEILSLENAAGDSEVFLDTFFARACLQPVAEALQLQLPADASYGGDRCPACSGVPQMSVLRPESEGASRWLVCSFCLREWRYRRLACPSCGEEDKEKLPRYSAKECAYVHVEACDSCRRYLKAVDMTIDGRAVPMVDEAALVVLDVWASNHGYAKTTPNLLGF